MCYRKHLITAFILLPFAAFCQDITGLWKGTLYNDTTQQFYSYEIGISQEKGKLSGFSHTWFVLGDKQFFGVKKVAIKKAPDGKIIIEDDGLISNNYPVSPNKNVRQLNVLTLNASDSIMTLEGPYSTNRTKEYHSLTGHVKLQRKNDFWQSALVPHLQELGIENKLSFVKEENDLLALVEKKQDEAAFKALDKQFNKPTPTSTNEEAAALKAAEAQKKAEEKNALAMQKEQAAQADKAARLLAQQRVQQEKEQQKLMAKETQKLKEQQSKEQQKSKVIATADDKVVIEKSAAKTPTSIVTAPKPSLPATVIAPAAKVSERKTVLQQTVNFTSDSLLLTLYDNGEIDGDTVSVLMNGELIVAKQGLSTTAAKKTIYIPRTMDRVELVMYAESLGSIPPNTGLLVIRDGKDLYEIRFSGDLQKNASIVFNRKKE